MAYNFIATSAKEPDWQKVHTKVFNENSAIEMFPIETGKVEYQLGISIPFVKLERHPNTWEALAKTIKELNDFGFRVFDLYNGFYVDDGNLNKVKQSLFG